MKTCTVDDCTKHATARGLCPKHYARWRTHGSTNGGPMVHGKPEVPCSVQECTKRAVVLGVRGDARVAPGRPLCPMHYQQIRAGVDPRPPKPSGHYRDGYFHVSVNGRTVAQHRNVMEQSLGRQLFPHENVHHINGVRDDNRPENLELWSTSQPSGQRALDKLEWAYRIVELYAHTETTNRG